MYCEKCGKKTKLQKHHLLSNTAKYSELYEDILDDSRNIMMLCQDCHMSKSLKKLTELEFCEMVGIKPRSKTLLSKIAQNKIFPFWIIKNKF